MSTTKKSFKKILKRIVLYFLAVILLLNLYILFSGRTYLYKGIESTYLKGKTGPTIYDSIVFPVRTAESSSEPVPWRTRTPLIQLNEKSKELLKATQTTSFLIVKDGEIIHESYYGKHTELTRSNSFSMAKSLMGLLIGIAIDEGKISGFDAPVADYLPFHLPGEENVTIRDVMGMSSGLNWSESGVNPFSDNAAAYYTSDLPALLKKKKFIWKPGSKFEYASGNSELLGIMILEVTGKYPTTYLEDKIWSKIDAENKLTWSLDHKDGLEKAFCCAYATTRDFARIGQLILNNGQWNGKQIISSHVLKEILAPYSSKEPFYGLQFWRYNQPKHPAVYLRGILGQYIIVVPSLNVVMVRTGKERKGKYVIPKDKKDDKAYIENNQFKAHHPADIFDYFTILDYVLRIDQ